MTKCEEGGWNRREDRDGDEGGFCKQEGGEGKLQTEGEKVRDVIPLSASPVAGLVSANDPVCWLTQTDGELTTISPLSPDLL